jgi:hypothetical protein
MLSQPSVVASPAALAALAGGFVVREGRDREGGAGAGGLTV